MPRLRRLPPPDPLVVARLEALPLRVPALGTGFVPPVPQSPRGHGEGEGEGRADGDGLDLTAEPRGTSGFDGTGGFDGTSQLGRPRTDAWSSARSPQSLAVQVPSAAAASVPPANAGGGAEPGQPTVSSPLERWRRGRVDPGRHGVVVLAVVAVLAAVLAGVVVLRARPHAVLPPDTVVPGVAVPGAVVPGSGATTASPPGRDPAAPVVVSVNGAVVRPGLVSLPPGSRVDDAVQAAGGVLPGTDLGALNLARKLQDGEQVLVGLAAPAAAGPGAVSGSGGTGALVDLNTATLADLDGLPGIGPVLAQKLLDWRTEHGRFASVDQLREVGGIGESKYAEIKDRVTV